MINELVMEKQEFKERYFVHVVSSVFTRLIFLKTVCHLFYFYRLANSGIEVRSVLTLVGQGASEVSGSSQMS